MAESTRGTRVLQMPDGTITRNYQTQELHVATQSLDLRVPMTATASSISSTPSFRTPTSSQDPPAATVENLQPLRTAGDSSYNIKKTSSTPGGGSGDSAQARYRESLAEQQSSSNDASVETVAVEPTEARGSKRPR